MQRERVEVTISLEDIVIDFPKPIRWEHMPLLEKREWILDVFGWRLSEMAKVGIRNVSTAD